MIALGVQQTAQDQLAQFTSHEAIQRYKWEKTQSIKNYHVRLSVDFDIEDTSPGGEYFMRERKSGLLKISESYTSPKIISYSDKKKTYMVADNPKVFAEIPYEEPEIKFEMPEVAEDSVYFNFSNLWLVLSAHNLKLDFVSEERIGKQRLISASYSRYDDNGRKVRIREWFDPDNGLVHRFFIATASEDGTGNFWQGWLSHLELDWHVDLSGEMFDPLKNPGYQRVDPSQIIGGE